MPRSPTAIRSAPAGIGQLAIQAREEAGIPQSRRRGGTTSSTSSLQLRKSQTGKLDGILKSLELWMAANTHLGPRDIRTLTRTIRIVAREAKPELKDTVSIRKPIPKPKQMKHLGSSLAHLGRFHTLSDTRFKALLERHGRKNLAWKYRIRVSQVEHRMNPPGTK